MTIKLELTLPEARLLAHLLELASDEFSNHGCNDLDVARVLKVSEDQAKKIVLDIVHRMIETGMVGEDYLEDFPSSSYLMDWMVFSHFKRLVKKELACASSQV